MAFEKHRAETSNFAQTLSNHRKAIDRGQLKVLQVNITSLCNQVCAHCHVNAGPERSENMSLETMERLLFLLRRSPSIQTADITGGAPELNQNFRYLVSELSKSGVKVLVRSNLTALLEPGQKNTAEFLAVHKATIIASMPYYTRENVDTQRGPGVFDKSVKVLKILNELGYGKPGTGLELNLVYNPDGAFLPRDQKGLENDYRQRLGEDHNIEFNNLLTIANMPIGRFQSQLEKGETKAEYIKLLQAGFNPDTAEKVMCRELISVDWDGGLHDCDFNQALGIPVPGENRSIWEMESFEEISSRIALGDHCYACAAGAGSS